MLKKLSQHYPNGRLVEPNLKLIALSNRNLAQLNLNSTSAYQSLRDLRAKEVAAGKTYSGTLLAGTLIKYSERGQAYIDGLRHLISYNKLGLTDDTYLSNNKLVHLVY